MGTRKKAAPLRSAPGATKRAASKPKRPTVLGMTAECAQIRELLTDIPRIWASDPRDLTTW